MGWQRFRWASLQLQHLCSPKMKIEDDVRCELLLIHKETPIHGIYSKIFDQILHDDPYRPSCLVAERVLKWLLCSRRQLSKEELIAAACFDLQTSPTAEQIQSICRNLVILDKALGEFRFANASVTTLLKTRKGYDDESSHAVAAERCLRCFLRPADGSTTEDPLRSYAALHWAVHCDMSPTHRRNGPLGQILADFVNKATVSELEIDSWSQFAKSQAILIPWDEPFRRQFESMLSKSSTLLFASCIWGWEDVIQQYKASNADIAHPVNAWGQTGLQVASQYGHGDIVETLLEAGAAINAKANDGSTALHQAVGAIEYQAIVKLLLENGASVDAEDCYGRRALHTACENGYGPIVSVLIEHGADIAVKDVLGTTALTLALRERHEAVALQLLSAGPKIQELAGGWKALHMAAAQGIERLVEELLKMGADVMVEDPTKMTPLHRAALAGHESVSSTLVAAGADIMAKDEGGFTPLTFAAARGYERIVRLLLDAQVDAAEASDNQGCTALHHAAASGHKAVVGGLLDHGADIQARDNFGKSPLHHAVTAEQTAVVDLLMEVGAIDVAADDGKLSLHLAAERGYLDMVNVLLLRRFNGQVDIDKQDSEGRTALHLAAKGGHASVVELLEEFGADDSIRDYGGVTFLERAFLEARPEELAALGALGETSEATR
jgi:ankyrin repeat protein